MAKIIPFFVVFVIFVILATGLGLSGVVFYTESPGLYCVNNSGDNNTYCQLNDTLWINISSINASLNYTFGTNPFDQDLNTTSWPTFNQLDITDASGAVLTIGTGNAETFMNRGHTGQTARHVMSTAVGGLTYSFGLANSNDYGTGNEFYIGRDTADPEFVIYNGAITNRVTTSIEGNLTITERIGVGTTTPQYLIDISDNTSGIVRTRLKNLNTGSGVVVGALQTVENGHGIWGGMGMTGHATLQGGKFNHTFHLYNQGYGDSLYTVDGNKSHVWFSDPTDGHNFGFDEIMRLRPNGDLIVNGNATINLFYASMYYNNDSGMTSAIGAADEYFNITLASADALNGFTESGGKLTALVAGKYKVDYSFSFGGGPNDEYHMTIGVNGAEMINCHNARKIGSGGDVGNSGGTCFIDLVATDVVTFMIENEDDSDDVTVQDLNVNLLRISS